MNIRTNKSRYVKICTYEVKKMYPLYLYYMYFVL